MSGCTLYLSQSLATSLSLSLSVLGPMEECAGPDTAGCLTTGPVVSPLAATPLMCSYRPPLLVVRLQLDRVWLEW